MLFCTVMLKIEFYTSKHVNHIIQDPSNVVDGLKENVSLDSISLNSNVPSAFL